MNVSVLKTTAKTVQVASTDDANFTVTAKVRIDNGNIVNYEDGTVVDKTNNNTLAIFSGYSNLNVQYINLELTIQQEVNTAINNFKTACSASTLS